MYHTRHFNPALRTAFSPTDLDDMHAAEYLGSRGETLDYELRHEIDPADYAPTPAPRLSNSSMPATPKQVSFLRTLIAQANRAGYAHGLRYGFADNGLLKAEAGRAIDMLVSARDRRWR